MICSFTLRGELVPYREFVYRVPIMHSMCPVDLHPGPYSANASSLAPRYEERVHATVERLKDDVTVTLHPSRYTLAKKPMVILHVKWALEESPSVRKCEEFLYLGLKGLRHPN